MIPAKSEPQTIAMHAKAIAQLGWAAPAMTSISTDINGAA
jgi:hypothetical protein